MHKKNKKKKRTFQHSQPPKKVCFRKERGGQTQGRPYFSATSGQTAKKKHKKNEITRVKARKKSKSSKGETD